MADLTRADSIKLIAKLTDIIPVTMILSHKIDDYFYALFPDLKGSKDNATSFF